MENKKAGTVAFRSIAVAVGFRDRAIAGFSGKNGFVCKMMGDYSRVHLNLGYTKIRATPGVGAQQDCMVEQD